MRRLSLFLVLLLQCAAWAEGPIPTRNQRAVSLAFLRMEPLGPALPEGVKEARVAWILANDLRASDNLMEDYEVSRILFAYRKGLPGDAEWGVQMPWVSRGGGILDGVIDWWHANVLGWTDPLRDQTPRNGSVVQLPGSRRFGSADGFGDVTVWYGKGWGGRWIARGALKLPTGNARELLGSGAIDAGVRIEREVRVGARLKGFAGVGAVWQGRPTHLAGARDVVLQASVSLVWAMGHGTELVVQWDHEDSALRLYQSANDAPHRLLTFGCRMALDNRRQLELFFSEDRDLFNGSFPEGANIGPDFTLGAALTARF